jgi:hypothetical protein
MCSSDNKFSSCWCLLQRDLHPCYPSNLHDISIKIVIMLINYVTCDINIASFMFHIVMLIQTSYIKMIRQFMQINTKYISVLSTQILQLNFL